MPETVYRPASWESILFHGRPRHGPRRQARPWGVLGVALMAVGALLISSPLLALAWLTRDTGTDAAVVDGTDGTMLARAHAYDRRLLSDPTAATGEAADPFAGTDAPAWRSDENYLGQLGAGGSMARIRIPRIGVDLPIGHGTSAGVLEQGAGHVYGTTLPVGDPGNTVVAAHRGLDIRLLFYRVGELGAGDMIYTSAGGRTVAWKVDRRYTARPGSAAETRAMSTMGGRRTLLTLYTCDPPGLNTRRLIVRAHRVPYDDAARRAERQADLKGLGAWWTVFTLLTLTLMLVLQPSEPVMRHSTRRTR